MLVGGGGGGKRENWGLEFKKRFLGGNVNREGVRVANYTTKHEII